MLLVVVLCVLLLFAVAAVVVLLDAVGAGTAERKASEHLSVPFGNPATVRVVGRPFLTQALRGRYREVEVYGGGLRVGEMTGATLHARLHNVYLPFGDLVRRRVAELPCEHLEGRILLPFGELARVARIPGLSLSFDGQKMLATAALPVAGINQLARVSGEAVLTLKHGNTVWLRIRGVSVAGLTLPGRVLDQLLPALSVPIPLPHLPYGLYLDELTPTPTGLAVHGSADAVVFRTG